MTWSAWPVAWDRRFDIAQAGTVTLTVALNGALVSGEVRDRVVEFVASLTELTAKPRR